MKKNLFAILVLVLALLLSTACAESAELSSQTVTGKTTLWSHEVELMDQADRMVTYPVNVTFEPKAPVELTIMPVADALKDEICIARVTREGLGTVMIAISPANRGLHFNMNNYTEEMLADYIKAVAEANFADGQYTSEVCKSEGGNTYVRVGTEYQETLSTIYDDFSMEFYLMREPEGDQLVPLTAEDHAFAVEMFQSVWTEEANAPTMDMALTVNVHKEFVAGLGISDAEALADLLNQVSFQIHAGENILHVALKSGEDEILYADFTEREENSLLLQSNVLGDKGILFADNFINKDEQEATSFNPDELLALTKNIDLTSTISAALGAADSKTAEDGSTVITVSAENAKKVLTAFGEDIKASGMLGQLVSMVGIGQMTDEEASSMVDMAVGMLSGMLQEQEFLDVTIGSNANGDQTLNGRIHYIGSDGTAAVPSTVSFAVSLHIAEGELKIDVAGNNGPDGAETLQSILLNVNVPASGEFSGEFAVGATTGAELKKDFSITLKKSKSSEELGSMDIVKLSFNTPDKNGELQEMFSLVNLSTGSGEDNIQAIMLYVAGYEDPVLVIRAAQVFAEERTVTEPAEIIRAEDLTPEQTQEILKTVVEKLESISAEAAEMFRQEFEAAQNETAAQ